MSLRPVSILLGGIALAVLSACAVREERVVYQQPAPVVRPAPVYAEYGRVENIGYVQISQRPSGAGAVLGAVIGGVVGGAIVGNAIEGRQRREDELYRVQVRFDNGSVRDYDFQRIDDLRIGDRVKFEGGQLHRL